MFKFNIIGLILLFARHGYTAPIVWSSPPATTPANWGTAGNWTPASVPNAIDAAAAFTSANATATTVTIDTNYEIGSINIDSSANNYNFQASIASNTLIFQTNAASASFSISNSSVDTPIFVPIQLNSPLIVNQNSTSSLSFNREVNSIGTQSLTKNGSGVLNMLATTVSNYSGGTFINEGTLNIHQDFNLGQAGKDVTIGGATLGISPPPASTTINRPFHLIGDATVFVDAMDKASLTGVLDGVGSLTKTGAGILVLSNTNTYQSGTNISSGELQITTDSNLGDSAGNLNITNGTLALTGSGFSTNRLMNVSGATPMIQAQPNTTNTFAGDISGSGSLTFTQIAPAMAPQTIYILSGSNSYTKGTFVGDQTIVSGTTNSLQGNITTTIDPSSAIVFDQDFDGTYAGTLSGGPMMPAIPNPPFQLAKIGIGSVTFTGSSPFTGTTHLLAGSLIINGSLSNSNAYIESGATLGGLGTIGFVETHGIINPGDGSTVGPLIFNGGLGMFMDATTHIDITPNSADQIIAQPSGMFPGQAHLDGALIIDPEPGFYGFADDYTILTSTGLFGTQFATVHSTSPSFIPTVSYTTTDVLLHVDIASPFAIFPFSNENTEAVGHNIDDLFATGQLSNDLFNIFQGFKGQSIKTINHALDQMHPSPYSAFTEMQAEVNSQLISVFHHLPYLSCCSDTPNRFWIQGLGNSLTVKDHGIQIGFQANTGGIAIGYDGKVNDSLVLGIGGAWTNNHLHWKHERGHGKSNSLYGSLYFDSQVGSFYFGGTFLGGLDFYTTSRNIDFLTTHRHATSQFQALELMGQIRSAYLFGAPQVYFYPYFNLDCLYQNTRKFSERNTSGLNLNVFAHTDITLRSEVGLALQVQDRNYDETICISPLVAIGYVNMTPIERPLLKSTFQESTIPYKVLGWQETWHLMNLDFGLTFSYNCFSLMVDYNVEFSCNSEKTFFNQHGDFHLDWKW